MNNLKFSRFLFASFTCHLLLALAISLYYSTSYIPVQPIKTKVYFQKSSKTQTSNAKSNQTKSKQKTLQSSSKSSSTSNFDNNLARSLKQLNLEADEDLLREVQEGLDVVQEPDLKNIQLNQPSSPNITNNNKKTTTQNLTVKTEASAVDSTQQNNEYKKLIEAIIQNNWKSSFSDKKLQVIIQAKILKTGALDDVKIVRNSRLSAFDLSALEAIKNSHPFPVIPNEYRVKEFVFVFRFQGGRIL